MISHYRKPPKEDVCIQIAILQYSEFASLHSSVASYPPESQLLRFLVCLACLSMQQNQMALILQQSKVKKQNKNKTVLHNPPRSAFTFEWDAG